ncbi:MAG: STAS domain-containing protein [Solirubrobacteraceae bacterium]
MKPGELEIIHERHGARDELLLAGELDLASADELERRIAMLCLGGGTEIVLDLERLIFVDSAGLRAMLAARQTCAQSGCSMTLRNCSERVERVLELTGMTAALPVSDEAPSDGAPWRDGVERRGRFERR